MVTRTFPAAAAGTSFNPALERRWQHLHTLRDARSGISSIATQHRLGSRPRLLGGYAPFEPRAHARWSGARSQHTRPFPAAAAATTFNPALERHWQHLHKLRDARSGFSSIATQRRLGSRPRLLGGYAPFEPRAHARWSRARSQQRRRARPSIPLLKGTGSIYTSFETLAQASARSQPNADWAHAQGYWAGTPRLNHGLTPGGHAHVPRRRLE